MLRIMKFSTAAALVAFSGAFGCGAVVAQAQTYKVGVENIEYYPQYSYKNGEYGGFARALLDAFAKDKGYTFQYQALPVIRLFSEFVNLELDLKYPDNEKWSSDMKSKVAVVYSDPVVAYIDGVNVLPQKVGKPAAEIKTLGAVRGFTPWDWLEPVKSGAVKLQENNSFAAMLETAAMGRVDGAYGNISVAADVLERELKQPGVLVFDPGLPHTRAHYHLSSIKHPQLIAEFNAWMKTNAAPVADLKARFQVEKGVNRP
jgi:polar amino acid transport system substrate-binding protein